MKTTLGRKGIYLNEEYGDTYIISKEGNKLVSQPWENAPKTELIPQSDLHFLAPGLALSFGFVKDKTVQVVQIKEDTDYHRIFKKINQ